LHQYIEFDWKALIKGELDLTELEACLKRVTEIVDLRNVLEELMKV